MVLLGPQINNMPSKSHVIVLFFSDRWAAKFSKVWGFACTPAARKSSAIICKKKCFFFKPLKLWAYLISAGRVTTAGITQKNNDKQQT